LRLRSILRGVGEVRKQSADNGVKAAVEAEGKEPSDGREAHDPVRVRN
jgi:hypothetical protein